MTPGNLDRSPTDCAFHKYNNVCTFTKGMKCDFFDQNSEWCRKAREDQDRAEKYKRDNPDRPYIPDELDEPDEEL